MYELLIPCLIALLVGSTPLTLQNTFGQGPKYRLTWVQNTVYPGEMIRFRDINNWGYTVGESGWHDGLAFMFDEPNGLRDLNELNGIAWIDATTGQQWNRSNTPWTALSARGTNDNNLIVGTAQHNNGEYRVFVLEGVLSASPVFILFAKSAPNDFEYGEAINDGGDVVGWSSNAILVYNLASPSSPAVSIPLLSWPRKINNQGVIVTFEAGTTEGYIITPTIINGARDYSQATWTHSTTDGFYGINDSGMVCGNRVGVTSGPPKNRFPGGPFLFQPPGLPTSNDLLVQGEGTAFFCDVNNMGDVAFTHQLRGRISIAGQGIFNLDNQIEFESPAERNFWMNYSIQTQGINDDGQIIVRIKTVPQSAGVLTPIPPDPNAPLVYNSADTPLNIPDNKPNGITSTINVSESSTISNLVVRLKITHQRPTDLTVWLYHPSLPSSTRVQLTNFDGDNPVTLFNGQSSAGNWKVQVIDSVKQRTGKLDTWRLTIER
jgi:hypothetical protein